MALAFGAEPQAYSRSMSRRRLREISAFTLSLVMLSLAGPAIAGPGDDRPVGGPLSFEGSPPTVRGGGCTPSEGELSAPSPVHLRVTHFFVAGERASGAEVIATVTIIPATDGTWSYTVPTGALAVVPPWAEIEVFRAEADCGQTIGPGYDYRSAELRILLRRQGVAAASAPVPAAPAEPVSGAPLLTG
jgi:hypothetical protein